MQIRAILFLIIATSFWGLNFHLGKVMLHDVSFIEAGFWRYALGVLMLWLIIGRKHTGNTRADFKANHIGLLLVGVIGLFGFNLFFFLGLKYTSALNAALIVALNPAQTVLLDSLILRNPIQRAHKIGLLIALAGVVILLTRGEPQKILSLELARGDLLILVANLVFSLHHVWVKKYSGRIPHGAFTFWTNAICLLGFVLLLPFVGVEAMEKGGASFWLAALGMGIPGTALAYLLWNQGVVEVGAARAGFFMNVVPLATALLAVFFGETLAWYHLYSGLLILSGIIYSRIGIKKLGKASG
ncbi:MAG: DMT family transporter [Bacteroidota bacterium]